MKKIKYLTPILGLTAMVGVATPIATSCAKTTVTNIVPYNLLDIEGVTLKGIIAGSDLTKYDTLVIPEGIEYISESAFDNYPEWSSNGEEKTMMDYSTIKTLKLPASIRSIEDYAFYSLTKLTNIDLTSWTPDTIHYAEIESDAFYTELDLDNESKYCKVNLPQGLSMAQIEILKGKLDDIPDWWYIDQTTGHIAATDGVAKTADAVMTYSTFPDYATDNVFSLTLAETFDTTKYELEVLPQITARSLEKIYIYDFNFVPPTDFKTVKFGLDIRVDHDPAVSGDLHEINFDLNVICRKKSSKEVVWTEKVEGFKTTNKYTHVGDIEILNKPDVSAIWLHADATTPTWATETEPAIQITPAEAVNPYYEWTTSDESVVSIEKAETGEQWAKCVKPGESVLSVVADDGGASDSINVVVPGIVCDVVTCGYEKDETSPYYHKNMVGSRFGQKSDDSSYYGYTIPAEHELTFKINVGSDTAYDTIKTATDGKSRTFQVVQATADAGRYKEQLIKLADAEFWYVPKGKTLEEAIPLAKTEEFTIDYDCVAIMDSTPAGKAVKFIDGDTIYIKFVFAEDATGIENVGLLTKQVDQ